MIAALTWKSRWLNVIALAVCAHAAHGAQVYSFTSIATRNAGIAAGPSLNESGAVAFASFAGPYTIWRGDGVAPPNALQSVSGDLRVTSYTPSIDDSGSVTAVFPCGVALAQACIGVFGDGPPTVVAIDRRGGTVQQDAFGKRPSISKGFVAYAVNGSEDENYGVYVWHQGTSTLYAPGNFGDPDINGNGIVAFRSSNEILVGAGGPLISLVTTEGIFREFRDPVISDQELVVFFASLVGPAKSIFMPFAKLA